MPAVLSAPGTDTVGMMPAKALCDLHMDPEGPTAGTGDGLMLASLPAEAIDTIVSVAGRQAGTPLGVVELRLVGGEMKRVRPANGALAAVDADYALFAAGPAPSPQATTAVARSVAEVHRAMGPWAARQMYLNLAETHRRPGSFWTPEAYDRLRRIKAAVDPDDLIRSNHPIPPYHEGTPS